MRFPICFLAAVSLLGCDSSPAPKPVVAAASKVRAARRAYDGAPPVIPHPHLSGTCTTCHGSAAVEVPGVGLAPPNPHLKTPGLSEKSRCRQCHVFTATDNLLQASAFSGLPAFGRKGDRLHPLAPPTMPHPLFMHEDCLSCHSGAAARPEILCTHPERIRCLQCHVPNRSSVAIDRESNEIVD
jgi:nitrate reductase (cytochrome), electron transfer subunit